MFSSNFHLYVIYFFLLIYGLFCLDENNKLQIISSSGNLSRIEESVNNTLELTCRLQGFHKGLNVNLSWQLPKYNKNRFDVLIENFNDSLKLILNQVNEKDSGEYICNAFIDQETLQESVIVHVRQKPCVNMFECNLSSRCIHQRYVCDGLRDCDNGLDESPNHCGEDPCKGKIWCPNGRCIPTSWCCHPLEPNCTARVRSTCCPPLPSQDDYLFHQNILNNQHYTEMTFLQSTIYTIAGFAMAFMSIVTILMICICRIYLQRSIVLSVPRRQPSTSLSPTPRLSSSQTSGVNRGSNGNSRMFVSYSIPSNGLEIIGDVCQPPPYSEVTRYSDPPPSYKDIFNNRTDEESETSPCLSHEKPPP